MILVGSQQTLLRGKVCCSQVGTGYNHALYVLRDTEEEDKEELEEYDVLDQAGIEFTE